MVGEETGDLGTESTESCASLAIRNARDDFHFPGCNQRDCNADRRLPLSGHVLGLRLRHRHHANHLQYSLWPFGELSCGDAVSGIEHVYTARLDGDPLVRTVHFPRRHIHRSRDSLHSRLPLERR